MITLSIGGTDFTKQLIQDSYSAPLTAVKDSEHCFTAADGTSHEPVLGYDQTLDFMLHKLDDEAVQNLYAVLIQPKFTVKFNLPIKRTVKCCCQSVSSAVIISKGEKNLWQVQVQLKCLELYKDSDSL